MNIFTIQAYQSRYIGPNVWFWWFLVIFGVFRFWPKKKGIVRPKSRFLDSIWKLKVWSTSGYPRLIGVSNVFHLKNGLEKILDFHLCNFWHFCSDLTMSPYKHHLKLYFRQNGTNIAVQEHWRHSIVASECVYLGYFAQKWAKNTQNAWKPAIWLYRCSIPNDTCETQFLSKTIVYRWSERVIRKFWDIIF